MSIDHKVSKYFLGATKNSDQLNMVMIFGAKYLIFVMAGSALVCLWRSVNPEERIMRFAEIAVAALASWLVTLLIEFSVGRLRPYQMLQEEPLIRPLGETPSFPSAHATIAFSLATIVFLHNKTAGIILFVLAAIVAFSRVYVGVHYLSDVAAGAVIGIVVSLVLHLLMK